MKVTVKVTQDHIDKATKGCTKCPIALAVRSLGFRKAVVALDVVYLSVFDHEIKLPHRAKRFIEDFDGQRPVKPCQFTLSLTLDQWKERTV